MTHVDGFRFDLASVLGRDDNDGFDVSGAFFDAVAQDPVLNRNSTLLIAEPRDIGTYQVGNFPSTGRSGMADSGTPYAGS